MLDKSPLSFLFQDKTISRSKKEITSSFEILDQQHNIFSTSGPFST